MVAGGREDPVVQPGSGRNNPLPLPGNSNTFAVAERAIGNPRVTGRLDPWRAGCDESRTSGSEGGPKKRTGPKGQHRAPGRPYVVLCKTRAQAEQAQERATAILGELGLSLHPDKTRVVDLRQGKEGFDFLGCHLHARMSGKMWEQRRVVRYYLHRWPSQWSMKRARTRVKALTGRSQVGMELKAVIGRLNLFLRGLGNYFRTGNGQVRFDGPLRGVAAAPLAGQEAGPQPACRPSGPLDPHLVPRPGPVQAHGHNTIPEGGVTMSRRPSVSRMRENRTYGLKGDGETGSLCVHRAPDYQWLRPRRLRPR